MPTLVTRVPISPLVGVKNEMLPSAICSHTLASLTMAPVSTVMTTSPVVTDAAPLVATTRTAVLLNPPG